MSKRIKIIMVALSVVMIALSAMCMGMTLAIWTSSTNGDGDTVAPTTDSTQNWNAWAKYFDGTVIDENLHTASLTSFHSDDYGLNLETVIIPQIITIGGNEYHVVEIGNQVFADATLKQLPVTVYISPSVTHICTMAFANLPNLTKVVFGTDRNGLGETCVIDDFAFMMSDNLVSVVTNGRTVLDMYGEPVTADGMAFLGCENITVIENL